MTEQACVLVTLTLLLARLRVFPEEPQKNTSRQGRLRMLMVFLLMALAENAVAAQGPLMNTRVIAACAAGLLGGPWVGVVTGLVAALLDTLSLGHVPAGLGLPMILSGGTAGLMERYFPKQSRMLATGMVFGFIASLMHFGGASLSGTLLHSRNAPLLIRAVQRAVVDGLGVSLILLVVAQVQAQDRQARAAAMAEVSALQARMNPHFLFNALNTVSALSLINASAIPMAVAHLSRFLRASIDMHDRHLVPLQEELEIVAAYLEIEALRMGSRLCVEYRIAPDVLDIGIPPFLIQPLVENAVRHGIENNEDGGRVCIAAFRQAPWLVVTVTDSRVGTSSSTRVLLPDANSNGLHALALIRRRLLALYGSRAALNLISPPGVGTTATVRVPEDGFDAAGG